jgi:hypothetical protein
MWLAAVVCYGADTTVPDWHARLFVVQVTVGRYSCERDEAMMGHENDQHASGGFRRFVVIANPSGGGSANGLHELL